MHATFLGSVGPLALVLATLAPGPARGDARADRAADAGVFSAWSVAPRAAPDAGALRLSGSWDAATRGARFDTLLEVKLLDRLALRAGATLAERTQAVRPMAGARLDVLRQEVSGIDLAVLSGYEPFGFNTVPALDSRLVIGRAVGRTRLLASAGFALGLQDGERSGDLRLAALQRAAGALQVGFDSRLRVDLERDLHEPDGEPDWDLVAGPTATVTAGAFAVSAGAGVSALQLRLSPDVSVGPAVHVQLGAVY